MIPSSSRRSVNASVTSGPAPPQTVTWSAARSPMKPSSSANGTSRTASVRRPSSTAMWLTDVGRGSVAHAGLMSAASPVARTTAVSSAPALQRTGWVTLKRARCWLMSASGLTSRIPPDRQGRHTPALPRERRGARPPRRPRADRRGPPRLTVTARPIAHRLYLLSDLALFALTDRFAVARVRADGVGGVAAGAAASLPRVLGAHQDSTAIVVDVGIVEPVPADEPHGVRQGRGAAVALAYDLDRDRHGPGLPVPDRSEVAGQDGSVAVTARIVRDVRDLGRAGEGVLDHDVRGIDGAAVRDLDRVVDEPRPRHPPPRRHLAELEIAEGERHVLEREPLEEEVTEPEKVGA